MPLKAHSGQHSTSAMKPGTVNRNAKAVLDHPKVSTRIWNCRRRHASDHQITGDSLIEQLQDEYGQAM